MSFENRSKRRSVHKSIKGLIGIILSIVIFTIMMPPTELRAADLTTVLYKKVTVDANHKVTLGDGSAECTMITGTTTTLTGSSNENEGWYAVKETVNINSNVSASGDVKLILMDGADLTIIGGASGKGGIYFTDDGTLTIYGQQNQSGKMTAKGYDGLSKIDYGGMAGLTINGGNVVLQSSHLNSYGLRLSSVAKLTVNGGSIHCENVSPTTNATPFGVLDGTIELNGGEITVIGKSDANGASGPVNAYGGKMYAVSGKAATPGVGGIITLGTDTFAYESASPITDVEADDVTAITSGTKASKRYVLIQYVSSGEEGGEGGGSGNGGQGSSGETPVSANLAVVKGKQNIKSLYKTYGESGYKYKFKIDNKSERKIFKVSSKGDLKAKKEGSAVVSLYRKVKKGKWEKAEEHTFKSELPEFEKKITMTAGETIEASKYTKKAISVSPNYISKKPAVATVDSTTGKITAVKKGSTKITATYGSGKGAAKYTIKVKVK